jgi:hypothetical protein
MRVIAALAFIAFLAGLGRDVTGVRPLRLSGRVVDAATGKGIPNAIVTAGSRERRSDETGNFVVDDSSPPSVIRVRAVGYLRTDAQAQSLHAPGAEIRLAPFRPKAVYLSVYGIGSAPLRTAALGLIDSTELNALVIDVKGDRGIIPYRSAIPLARTIGAQRVITVPDLPQLLARLKAQHIYAIARIVLFKDNLLATARSDLALHRRDGSLFRDREGLAWADPFSHEVWAHNIAIAMEAARAGFDEIQFDYARLPDTTGVVYSLPWTEQNREAAIDGFFTEARKRLVEYNVFLAADIFGYVCWNENDTRIGQKLEHLAGVVDYLSPMLYPSGFQFGIPGYRKPLDHPGEIVRLSLERARARTARPATAFRPWLQAFRDYAFDRRAFTPETIRKQIDAAEAFGADGWMLWNPQNQYGAAGLKTER